MGRTLGVEAAVGQRSGRGTRFSRSRDWAEAWDEPRTTFDPTGYGELELLVGHRSLVLSVGTLVNLAEDFLAERGSLLIQRSVDLMRGADARWCRGEGSAAESCRGNEPDDGFASSLLAHGTLVTYDQHVSGVAP